MDTVQITLPISKSVVEIRNYTTRNDDEKSEQLLYMGVEADQKMGGDKSEQSIKFPIANVMASQAAYIPRLVDSIDGDKSNIALKLGELKSEDYEAISVAVEKVVNEHSPKAKAVKNNKS